MIIGHGDIASVLRDREDRIYFASGVSNSGETRESEYLREIALLESQDRGRHLVYFSSLCVFQSDTRYARHKRSMETLVRLLFPTHTLLRLGNITWGSNPHTLLNRIRASRLAGKSFEVWDVCRYLVDKDEFLYWVDLIPSWSCEMNITGRRMKVSEIVDEISRGVL